MINLDWNWQISFTNGHVTEDSQYTVCGGGGPAGEHHDPVSSLNLSPPCFLICLRLGDRSCHLPYPSERKKLCPHLQVTVLKQPPYSSQVDAVDAWEHTGWSRPEIFVEWINTHKMCLGGTDPAPGVAVTLTAIVPTQLLPAEWPMRK